MDWLVVSLIIAVLVAFIFGYPKLNTKLGLEMKYPDLIAKLPMLLDAVDYMISRYYPAQPYLVLISVVKEMIKDTLYHKQLDERQVNKIVDYILNERFSAKVLISKDPENIPAETRAQVDSKIGKILGAIDALI
jgi:hypothetical protein